MDDYYHFGNLIAVYELVLYEYLLLVRFSVKYNEAGSLEVVLYCVVEHTVRNIH